jgi:hypothetical protein
LRRAPLARSLLVSQRGICSEKRQNTQ